MDQYSRYIDNIDYQELLKGFDREYIENIVNQVRYFTEKEAEKRDEIVLGYFGEEGIEKIVSLIVRCILSRPVKEDMNILDIGAGSGFFTVRIAERIWERFPDASLYAMDITPAMLSIIRRKSNKIKTFIGIAENIVGSIEYARRYLDIPKKFDVIYSTLTLHHCQDVEKVFKSINQALGEGGIAVIIDICKHPYEEFREEMGDIHLGFDPTEVREIAKKYFKMANSYVIPGLRCEESCRSVEMFSLCLLK